MLAEIGVDEELDGALAVGADAHHRRRHQPPSQRLADLKRGHLTLEEGAVREIPQWRLPLAWLVDGHALEALVADVGQKGVVGAARQQAAHSHLSAVQEAHHVVEAGGLLGLFVHGAFTGRR